MVKIKIVFRLFTQLIEHIELRNTHYEKFDLLNNIYGIMNYINVDLYIQVGMHI